MTDVLVVRFAGPLFYDDEFEKCLRKEGISYTSVNGLVLPTGLPSCKIIVQIGLDAPPTAGLALVALLRTLSPHTPLVVCSGDGRGDIHQQVRDMGAEFIPRPNSAQELLDQVKSLINKTAP